MENYKNLSMADVAYIILEENGSEISFSELFNKTCELKEISEDEKSNLISELFSNLSLDGRFAILKNNVIDLRKRRKFDEINVDMQSFYDSEKEISEEESDEESDETDNILKGDVDDEDEEELSEKEEY